MPCLTNSICLPSSLTLLPYVILGPELITA